MARKPLRILLTGERGSGKTTCCRRAAALLEARGVRCGGVLCPKILTADGEIEGIEILDLLGDPTAGRLLARAGPPLDGPRTGAYAFTEEGIRFGRQALERAATDADVVFGDEVGPLEMRGQGLVNLLELARNPDTPPFVLVVRRSLAQEVSGALAPLRTTRVEITPERRDEAPARLVELLAPPRSRP